MSTDAAAPAVETEPETTPTDLLENLLELGEALPVNFQPTSHSAAPLVAGLVWYLATGSLVPPKVEAPDEAAARIDLAELTALNEEKAKVAELERKLAAAGASPAAVAPAPVAPVAVEPTPIAAVEDTAPAAPVDPEAATPINADAPPVGAPPAGSAA